MEWKENDGHDQTIVLGTGYGDSGILILRANCCAHSCWEVRKQSGSPLGTRTF